MKIFNPFFFLAAAWAAVSGHAADLETRVAQLGADDYDLRLEARHFVEDAVFASTAPDARPEAQAEMENRLLDAIAEEPSEPALFFLLHQLQFVGGTRALEVLESHVQDANKRIADTALQSRVVIRERLALAEPASQGKHETLPAPTVDAVLEGPEPVVAFRRLLDSDSTAAGDVLEIVVRRVSFPERAALLRMVMTRGEGPARTYLVNRLPELDATAQRVVLGAVADLRLTEAEADVLGLAEGGDDEPVRDAIVQALGAIGTERSLDYLVEVYRATPWPAARRVAEAIARIPSEAFDLELLETARSEAGADQLAAIRLLTTRYPPETTRTLTEMLATVTDPKVMEALIDGLEEVGDETTVARLIQLVMEHRGSPLQRKMQLALKRVAVGLGRNEALWSEYFKPAIVEAAPDAAADLVILLDCVACEPALDFLGAILLDASAPGLSRAAQGALMRWPTVAAAEVWLAVAHDPDTDPAMRARAQSAILRSITSDAVGGSMEAKCQAALAAYRATDDSDFQDELLAFFAKADRHRDRQAVRDAFGELKDDPKVKAMLDAL